MLRRSSHGLAKREKEIVAFHQTDYGLIYHGDSVFLLDRIIQPASVDLIVTSPPYGLVRKKTYGNVDSHEYLEWFAPFAEAFRRVLKPNGSLVIDIGGAWNPGQPTRSLYHYELLLMLCRDFGFHLAQDFFWWSPSRLPSPAEWVTVRRIRVKDAVDCVWWLSPTPWPKASNRRVPSPYSESMLELLKNGYKAKRRPSGHDISTKFSKDNGAAIPPNLIAIPNTESNSFYLNYCRSNNLTPHPARFPAELPEFFIRMLTDPDDLVIDPFAGSCVSGEVAERLSRRWICCEIIEEYIKGAIGRFVRPKRTRDTPTLFETNGRGNPHKDFYKVFNPAILWEDNTNSTLPKDGGIQRPSTISPKKASLRRPRKRKE